MLRKPVIIKWHMYSNVLFESCIKCACVCDWVEKNSVTSVLNPFGKMSCDKERERFRFYSCLLDFLIATEHTCVTHTHTHPHPCSHVLRCSRRQPWAGLPLASSCLCGHAHRWKSRRALIIQYLMVEVCVCVCGKCVLTWVLPYVCSHTHCGTITWGWSGVQPSLRLCPALLDAVKTTHTLCIYVFSTYHMHP